MQLLFEVVMMNEQIICYTPVLLGGFRHEGIAKKMRFAAKWNAFCRKMEYVLPQNGMRFAAKWNAFCRKMERNGYAFALKNKPDSQQKAVRLLVITVNWPCRL